MLLCYTCTDECEPLERSRRSVLFKSFDAYHNLEAKIEQLEQKVGS